MLFLCTLVSQMSTLSPPRGMSWVFQCFYIDTVYILYIKKRAETSRVPVVESGPYCNKPMCFSEHVDPCLDGARVCVGHVTVVGSGDSSMRAVPEEGTKRSREELRELWRKAIWQQILLQRMERENRKLQGELEEGEAFKLTRRVTTASVENNSWPTL